MNVQFWPTAWEDLRYWQVSGDKIAAKLMGLIEECRRHPFKCAGKPEPLGQPVRRVVAPDQPRALVGVWRDRER